MKLEKCPTCGHIIVDKSPPPKTVDGVAIELGKTYYHFDGHGVYAVYANENTLQFNPRGEVDYFRIRDARPGLWVYSDELYSTEPAAWAAWKEAQWA